MMWTYVDLLSLVSEWLAPMREINPESNNCMAQRPSKIAKPNCIAGCRMGYSGLWRCGELQYPPAAVERQSAECIRLIDLPFGRQWADARVNVESMVEVSSMEATSPLPGSERCHHQEHINSAIRLDRYIMRHNRNLQRVGISGMVIPNPHVLQCFYPPLLNAKIRSEIQKGDVHGRSLRN